MRRIRYTVHADGLNNVMEFDHVIRVHSGGKVSEPPGIWAPELNDDELAEWKHIASQPVGWQLLNGYSSQHGYSGPIMHDAEIIGGRMARDILAQPGLYVALVNYASDPDPDCDDCQPECEGHESLAGAHMGETVYCNGSCNPSGEASPCDKHDLAGWAVAYIHEDEEN